MFTHACKCKDKYPNDLLHFAFAETLKNTTLWLQKDQQSYVPMDLL